MIGRRCLWGWLVAAVLLCTGCNEPCRNLAERTCKQVGGADPLCVRLKEIAAEPRAGDRVACEAGNEFIDELRRGG